MLNHSDNLSTLGIHRMRLLSGEQGLQIRKNDGRFLLAAMAAVIASARLALKAGVVPSFSSLDVKWRLARKGVD